MTDQAPTTPDTDARVYVEVSGLTGSGKSAVMGEIEIALKALGLPVEHDPDFQAEKNGTHADWQEALDLYKPTVFLTERNISRAPMTTTPDTVVVPVEPNTATITMVHPDPVIITDPTSGRVLFAIRKDGTVDGGAADATEAARIFAETVVQMMPPSVFAARLPATPGGEREAVDYLRLIAEGWEVIEADGSHITIQNPEHDGPQELVVNIDGLAALSRPAPVAGEAAAWDNDVLDTLSGASSNLLTREPYVAKRFERVRSSIALYATPAPQPAAARGGEKLLSDLGFWEMEAGRLFDGAKGADEYSPYEWGNLKVVLSQAIEALDPALSAKGGS